MIDQATISWILLGAMCTIAFVFIWSKDSRRAEAENREFDASDIARRKP